MAECDLSTFFLDSYVVQYPATQTAAQRTIRVALRDMRGHDRVGVFLDDAVRHLARFEIFRQHVFGKIGLFLIEIHRQNVEFHWRTTLYVEQQIEHRVAVFAARETHHHAVAFLDHREICDRTAHLFEQLGLGLRLGLHSTRGAKRRKHKSLPRYSYARNGKNTRHASALSFMIIETEKS